MEKDRASATPLGNVQDSRQAGEPLGNLGMGMGMFCSLYHDSFHDSAPSAEMEAILGENAARLSCCSPGTKTAEVASPTELRYEENVDLGRWQQ